VTQLDECPGEDVCLLLHDDVSWEARDRTLGSLAWRWPWLTLGLPAEAGAVVAPYFAATAEALGAPGIGVDGLRDAERALEEPGDRAHVCEHLYAAAGRALAVAGYLTPQTGVVAGLFAGEGLPKAPLESAEYWRRGLAGDVQRDTKNHGRPSQALCIWSGDVIDALVAEGHPIVPGGAGENISIRGVDWAAVRPGSILTIAGMRCQLSGWALPCAKNRRLFLPGPEGTKPEWRMDPDQHPGWSRAYAYVLTERTGGVEGTIRVGDAAAFS
jgi:MOSC domain-containing protein YiiM